MGDATDAAVNEHGHLRGQCDGDTPQTPRRSQAGGRSGVEQHTDHWLQDTWSNNSHVSTLS